MSSLPNESESENPPELQKIDSEKTGKIKKTGKAAKIKKIKNQLEKEAKSSDYHDNRNIKEEYRTRGGKLLREMEVMQRKRIENDVIYAILFGEDNYVLDSHVNGLIINVRETFKADMTESNLAFVSSLINESRDMKHFFIFLGLAHSESFLNFFLEGNPEKKVPRPPIVDLGNFMFFVTKCVKPTIDEVMRGTKTLTQAVHFLRPAYIANVGYYREIDPTKDHTEKGRDEVGKSVWVVEKDSTSFAEKLFPNTKGFGYIEGDFFKMWNEANHSEEKKINEPKRKR